MNELRYWEFRELPGWGEVPADVAIIGISPSSARPPERALMPFGGKSFYLVQEIVKEINSLGLSVYLTNLIQRKEPSENPRKKDIQELMKELSQVRPKYLLLVGGAVGKALLSPFEIRADHGTFYRKNFLWGETLTLCTYHWRAGSEDPTIRQWIAEDLERFFRELRGEYQKSAFHEVTTLSPEEFLRILPEHADVYLDTETVGLSQQLIRAGFLWESFCTFLSEPDELQQFLEFLVQRKANLIGHNLSYDLFVLHPLCQNQPSLEATADTMVSAHISGEKVLSLKHLSSRSLEFPGVRYFGVEYSDQKYLTGDLLATRIVRERFRKAESAAIYPVMMRWVEIAARTHHQGVQTQRLRELLVEEQEKLQSLLSREPEVNFNSPKQVADYLIQHKVRLIEKTASGQFKTDEPTLLELRQSLKTPNPALDYVLELRAQSKYVQLIQTLIDHLDERERVHPKLNVCGTETGRFSCQEPNLQQIPREGKIKEHFVPYETDDIWVLCDLSQAELRVAALLTKDQEFVQALQSGDVHRRIASRLFRKPEREISSSERKFAKRVVFGVLYGGGPEGLAKKAGISVSHMKELISLLYDSFPGFRMLREKAEYQIEVAQKFLVKTPFGRIRTFNPLDTRAAIRQYINTPVQSTASDLLLAVGSSVESGIRERGMSATILFPIHDSIILSAKESELESLIELFQIGFRNLLEFPIGKRIRELQLPVIGEMTVGQNWGQCESTNEAYAPMQKLEFSSGVE